MSNQSLKVTIANRDYNLMVPKEEEKRLMEAASIVNQSMEGYQKTQGIKDKQDAAALCALRMAGEIIELKKQNELLHKKHLNHIEVIDTVLTKHLALH